MEEQSEKVVVEPGTGFFKVQASERVLFLPAGPMARIFAARFLARKKRSRPYPARVYRLKRHSREIDLVGPGMGAPVAAMIVEQLIAGGARKIIALGFAGAISRELHIGDILLVSEAISDEGTSKDYFPELNPPLPGESLMASLQSVLEQAGEPFKSGKVFSTDAFFRETMAKVARFREQSALAVEMEMSALYTLARFRKVELAALVVISDELVGEEWKSGFKSPSLFLKFLKAGELALQALSQ